MTAADYRRFRKQLGLSIRALAERLEMSKTTIVRREQGESGVSREAEYALRWLAAKEKKESR